MKFNNSKNEKLLLMALSLSIILIFLWALLFHLAEWWTYFNSLYFAVMTFTTIWYWDFTPVTHLGKFFTMIYAILWVPLFIWVLSVIIESRMKKFILHHFEHHSRKIERNEQVIEWELLKEEKEIKTIQKEVKEIENEMKKDSIITKFIKKLKFKK